VKLRLDNVERQLKAVRTVASRELTRQRVHAAEHDDADD
jgi:hypothetical protein